MDATTLITQFANMLPDRWAACIPFAILMLSGLCNLLAIGLKPPDSEARYYALRKTYYVAVTWGALNLGHAANRLQCGRSGIMVQRKDVPAAKEALAKARIQFIEREEDR